jgi:leucyl aminopeptidase
LKQEELLQKESKGISTNVLVWTQAEFDAHWKEAFGPEGLESKLSDLKFHKAMWQYRVGSGHKVLVLWFGAKADGTLEDNVKLMRALASKAHAHLKTDKTEHANFVFPSSLLED